MEPPRTPQKRDNPLTNLIQRLNDDYGLGIEVPDRSLTPYQRLELARQDDEYKRRDCIYKNLQFLFYSPDGMIDKALDTFFIKARATSRQWVVKPQANPTALSSSKEPPKARTMSQKLSLQDLLLETLQSFKNQIQPQRLAVSSPGQQRSASKPPTQFKPKPRVQTDFPSSPSLSQFPDPESPSPGGQKRHSLDGDGSQATKRPKSGEMPAQSAIMPSVSAIDNVPSRRWLQKKTTGPPVNTPPFRAGHAVTNIRNTTSASSSMISFESLFSLDNAQKLQSTQTTTRQGSQRPKLVEGSHVAQDDDEFLALSSDDIQALDELIELNSQRQKTRPAQVREPLPREFSIPSDLGEEFDIPEELVQSPSNAAKPAKRTLLEERLQNIWPKFPRWLHRAPLAVAWEITRICLHCGVNLDDKSLLYKPAWADGTMNDIWKDLHQLPVFRGKSFPEKPLANVFAAALANFESKGNAVILSAKLDLTKLKDGPLFVLDMMPLRLDQGCRLTRKFGPDRFFEILIPSPIGSGGSETVINWLTQQQHSFVGRQWRAFYSKNAGYRKPARDLWRKSEPEKPTITERVHFFAESGHNFRKAPHGKTSSFPPAKQSINNRTDLKVSDMLGWLLQIDSNEWQPYLRLFSRIQLGLSKTFPAIVFKPSQIIHYDCDILSPIGEVMNDGIGRMSRNVAKRIRDSLGLTDIPSAVQGRMGSAKGMWLMDVSDMSDEDWIETYPSQRKWECDFVDPFHRTLEIRSIASQLKSAGLNLQLLPVLENRANDRRQMRQAISNRLTKDLQHHFDVQKAAFKRPIQFRQWVHESWSNRSERIKLGHIKFLAGLPDSREETLKFLLDSGFDPKKQLYLQNMAWKLQQQRCDTLKTKLNINIGRSAYMFMVVDFLGVLEENEIHVGFSSRFRDESRDTSYTLLADCDVLVARSPAHFVSDVQRVRAVFKSELHSLKDVIVFSSKGNTPLAKKLSGGDYDGDMAWVCWDTEIVETFVNAEMPEEPDLSKYIRKDTTKLEALLQASNGNREKAVYDMINKSFQFAMQPSFLGICTNYKEKLCYHMNSVSNPEAVLLSSLVGHLVDQSKQGVIFSNKSWEKLQKDHFNGLRPDEPRYKGSDWSSKGEPVHIIDYLKFCVAKPAIDHELHDFYQAMQAGLGRTVGKADDDAAHYWDPDLVVYFEGFHALASESPSWKAVLDELRNAIMLVDRDWRIAMNRGKKDELDYSARVKILHRKWQDITPGAISRAGSNRPDSKITGLLEQPWLADANETSTWALLRASTAFRSLYFSNPKFVWQMAGRQLAHIKAQMTRVDGGAPAFVTPLMYASLSPDARFIKQYVARIEGEGPEHPDADYFKREADGDAYGWGFGRYDDY
ncbi:RNA dependent RNA polymerase-domain-containing protein [Lasiosphaeria miniovina]|uniref:RNA-dependent RNA polymerase n=1 Tax=Lasiosphaeria miniovina TaxID=1954250 RepID=A0AA40DVU4_9PEZI|nr:RNA dependent RNA polymerase-domain-containing protein [Lasiosphaeria miniovina]KAK0717500.1 RNA dependent RNA polymerase-domain-containing protein [Lasiosphaeria miniovina]